MMFSSCEQQHKPLYLVHGDAAEQFLGTFCIAATNNYIDPREFANNVLISWTATQTVIVVVRGCCRTCETQNINQQYRAASCFSAYFDDIFLVAIKTECCYFL